jgi:hypothetical protein
VTSSRQPRPPEELHPQHASELGRRFRLSLARGWKRGAHPKQRGVTKGAKNDAAGAALKRVRTLCLALPEASERLSHGAPTFFATKSFVMFWNDHHGDGRLALWCAAPGGAQEAMIGADPERFFRPPYLGPRGWIGVRLDIRPDWDEISGVIEDAYRVVAPPKLVAQLDARTA